MKDFRLKHLTLRNFKGVADFSFKPDGADCAVHGDNATGKTTIRDAVFWLLTGKDSAGRANFEVKTLTASGESAHGLEHEVSATLTSDDGALTLRRTYHEDWRKKRGQAEREFTGHTTEFVVNDVPVQKKEFDAVAAEAIGPERTLRLLMDPEYFSDALAWKDRRALLLDVCGDVSDDDVIASSPALSDLAPLLDELTAEAVRAGGGDRVDALRRLLAAKKSKANKELEHIPVRIDEKQREVAQFDDVDVDALTQREQSLKEELATLEEQLAGLSFGGAISEARQRLSNAESALQEARTSARAIVDDKTRDVYSKLAGARALKDSAERKLNLREGSLRDHMGAVDDTKAQIADLETRRTGIEQEAFEGETVCYACGEPLKPEKLEAARAKFNERQAERLHSVDEKLEREREALRTLKDSVDDARESRDKAQKSVAEASARVETLQVEHDQAQAERVELPESLQSEIDDARQALESARESSEDGRSELQSKIAAKRDERDAIGRQLSRAERRDEALKRIKKLDSEQRRLASQFEEYERQLYLTEEFVRRKVSLLEERINERFAIAKFKLFDEQVQGGLVECCETTVNGVPYGTNLNHGARVAVGLEIIEVLQQHFEMRLPVLVDQAESITKLPEMGCQTIRLVVDAECKTLVV